MKNIFYEIKDFCDANKILHSGDFVILGFSGGPDSVFLLDIFNEMKEKDIFDFDFCLAYFNHDFRNDSDEEEAFVRSVAKDYGVDLYVGKRDEPIPKGQSMEMAARNWRKTFFNRLINELSADYLATAHNKNDQVETFILNITRGSGLNGLRAMLPKKGKYLKPILNTLKSDILNYLHEKNIKYINDSSNNNIEIQRNLIRHKAIPILEDINPRAIEHIFMTTQIVSGFIDNMENTLKTIETNYVQIQKHAIFIDREICKDFNDVMIDEFIRRILSDNILNIDWLMEEPTYIDMNKILRVSALLKNTSSKQFRLSNRVFVEVRKGGLYIFDMIKLVSWKNYTLYNIKSCDIVFGIAYKKSEKDNNSLMSIEIHESEFPLTIRRFKPGDMIKDKLSVARKLKRVFKECDIPVILRNNWPVVENTHGDVIWVPALSKRKDNLVEYSEYKKIIKVEEAPFGFK